MSECWRAGVFIGLCMGLRFAVLRSAAFSFYSRALTRSFQSFSLVQSVPLQYW